MEDLSALECFYYGPYFAGTHADAATFPLSVNPRDVTPKKVTPIFDAAYAGEQLTKRLRTVVDDVEFKAWSDVRNYLSRGGAPGRTHAAELTPRPLDCPPWVARSDVLEDRRGRA